MSLADLSATEISAAVAAGEASCAEVMTDHLDRIEALDPVVNAIVARRPRDGPARRGGGGRRRAARGRPPGLAPRAPGGGQGPQRRRGPAHQPGLPPADATARRPPTRWSQRGCGPPARSWSARPTPPSSGSGRTPTTPSTAPRCNAWDPSRSAGGSSGGAAVAVALRMLPVADGSDFFGSLRNPTGWNNVYGLRPSLGRVPQVGGRGWLSAGGVDGPVARTAPTSRRCTTPSRVRRAGPAGARPGRAGRRGAGAAAGRAGGWLGDLGGYLPMEPEVLEVCPRALPVVRRPRDGGRRGRAARPRPLRGPRATSGRPGCPGGTGWPASALAPLYADPVLRARMKPEAVFEVEGLLGDGVRPPLGPPR